MGLDMTAGWTEPQPKREDNVVPIKEEYKKLKDVGNHVKMRISVLLLENQTNRPFVAYTCHQWSFYI